MHYRKSLTIHQKFNPSVLIEPKGNSCINNSNFVTTKKTMISVMKELVGKQKRLQFGSFRKNKSWPPSSNSKSSSIDTDTTIQTLLLDDDFSVSSTISSESTTSSINSFSFTKPLKSCLKTSHNIQRVPKSSYQVLLPGKDEPITRSRCIEFYETVLAWKFPSSSQLTEDQIQQLWVQDNEYDRIRSKISALTKGIKDGKISKSTYCIRGLERKFQNDEIRQRRSNSLHSVLDEQDEQFHFGNHDESRISLIYAMHTWKSNSDAIRQGALDEASSRRALLCKW